LTDHFEVYKGRVRQNHQSPSFAFIDGDNVWKTFEAELKRLGIKKNLTDLFEFHRLFQIIHHDRCYVYSATNDATTTPKWLLDLEKSDGFIIKLGELVEKPNGRKQEGVDVKLAIDATRLAYSNVMKSCTLYGADGDFLPLVEAVSESGSVVDIVSFSDPSQGRVAPKLRAGADKYIRMNPAWVYETLKPERKTVHQNRPLHHDWNDAEDVSFLKVREEEFEIRKIEETYAVRVGGNSPSNIFASHILEDLHLWLMLIPNQ
jgi:uncharacterized LabA/DUF88 family protein